VPLLCYIESVVKKSTGALKAKREIQPAEALPVCRLVNKSLCETQCGTPRLTCSLKTDLTKQPWTKSPRRPVFRGDPSSVLLFEGRPDGAGHGQLRRDCDLGDRGLSQTFSRSDILREVVLRVAQQSAAQARTRKIMEIAAKYPAAREAQVARIAEVQNKSHKPLRALRDGCGRQGHCPHPGGVDVVDPGCGLSHLVRKRPAKYFGDGGSDTRSAEWLALRR